MINRNISFLYAASKCFDDVAIAINKDGGMTPVSEDFLGAPIADLLAESDEASIYT